jgi:rhodanese-related sulfurtransferase
MIENEEFIAQLAKAVQAPDQPLPLLCRSGGRSLAAARAAKAAGFLADLQRRRRPRRTS